MVPVAHNAGDFWPRRQFIKHAGVIRVVIGKPIPSSGRSPSEVMREAEEWIEKTVADIRGQPIAAPRRPQRDDSEGSGTDSIAV